MQSKSNIPTQCKDGTYTVSAVTRCPHNFVWGHSMVRFYLLSFIGILLSACADHTFDPDSEQTNGIVFATDLIQTRGASYTETGATTAYKSMGVYAASHNNDDFDGGSTTVGLMTNQMIERVDDSNGWYYSPAKAWQGTEKHSFFAYAPYNLAGLTVPATTVFGIPQMTYTVPTAVADQTDLLVSAAQYNLTDNATKTVKLTMNHALTRVVFSARTENAVATGSTITITKIELTDILPTGTRPMDFQPSQVWTASGTPVTYTLTTGTDGLTAGITLNQTLQHLNTTTGNLFLMPQAFASTSTAMLKVTYETTETATSTVKEKTIEKKLADVLDEWLQSEAIRFLITIPVAPEPAEFEVAVTYEAWGDHETSVKLPADPFLDITNVEVRAYDAAVTRVYFYTNYPKPDARIDPQGSIGTSTGVPFDVKDRFLGLYTNDPIGNPGMAYNFNLIKYDPADPGNTGKGYIDIVNVIEDNTTAGTKQPLILKLRAGNLVRDITVRPVISAEAAKQNATPYVGTFHRHNETGERIVTWHLPAGTLWTATIDNTTGTHTELCIDRLASPDFTTGQLYSFTPRNAEGATVNPETSVEGSGRVYFRVGWKSKTPTATTNRYARIKVTGANVGGAGVNEVIIYCRQGETEDPITGSASTYFAVYNAAQPRTFALYPSQVGMGYQWNSIKAWEPLNVPTPPGFPLHPGNPPTNPVYDITLPFSNENSACPEGYLLPNTLALGEMGTILTTYKDAFNWGYYADGFFDRRSIHSDHRVEASTLDVASAGFVLSTPQAAINAGQAPKSIFLSTGGDRNDAGQLVKIGTRGIYWSQETVADNKLARVGLFDINKDDSKITEHEKWHTHSLRCIKPAAGKAWVIRFDANGGQNAPLSLTAPYDATASPTITLPTAVPTNPKAGYTFAGWNTRADGTGQNFAAGGTYTQGTAVSNSTIPATAPTPFVLYAKWTPPVINEYIAINFANYMTPANATSYLLTAGSTGYTNYTSGSNGTAFNRASWSTPESNEIITLEKAYPKLVFGPIQSPATWSNAYDVCKISIADGKPPGTWRLPRASELEWLSSESVTILPLLSTQVSLELRVELFNGGDLWSGTNYKYGSPTTDRIMYGHTNGVINDNYNSTQSKPYRCVRQLP